MKTFEAVLNGNQSEMLLELSGAIGHESRLPKINEKPAKLIIDMGKVHSIDSFGINIWIRWMDENKNIDKIVLKSVPAQFVRQLQSFKNLIPANAEISSFLVPYYNEKSDEQQMILFTEGIQFKKRVFVNLPIVMTSGNAQMSVDADVEKFFAFLEAPITGNY